MKETGYDPDGAVLAAGGIPEYIVAQLQPMQTSLDSLVEDVSNFKYVNLRLDGSGWSDSAPYTQTVSVPGITEDWVPGMPTYIPSFNSDGSVDVPGTVSGLEKVAYVKILISGNGTLTAICPEDKPPWSMTLRVPGTVKR